MLPDTKPWAGASLPHLRKMCKLKESVVLIFDLLTNSLFVSSPGRDSVQYCNIGLLLSLVVRRGGNPPHSQGLIRAAVRLSSVGLLQFIQAAIYLHS